MQPSKKYLSKLLYMPYIKMIVSLRTDNTSVCLKVPYTLTIRNMLSSKYREYMIYNL